MCFQFSKTDFPEKWPSAADKHTHREPRKQGRKKVKQRWAALPASGSEAECSLFVELEGTPAWLELHSVLRGKEPAREQESKHNMSVPKDLRQKVEN